MVREFVSDVLRGRWMARDVRECRTALSGVFLVIGASEHNLLARFVRIGVEDEGSGFAKSAQAAGKCPAGDNARERRHVRLRIAAVHAERMQFENFAREVFVEPATRALAGGRI